MKKPIDPSLNDIFDIDALDLSGEAGGATEQMQDTKSTEQESQLTLNETVKQYSHHHHHHHSSSEHHHSSSEHHHSSGEHHHSSSEHHHSSSEQHHSSGEHHHSSGEHHHSSGEHHHSSGEHHHSSSGHHHSDSHKKKQKKKTSIALRIAIALLVLIFLFVAGGVGSLFYLQHKGKSDLTAVPTDTAAYDETIEYNGHKYVYNEDVVAIAFIGVDKRELESSGIIGTAGQADADLLLTVNTQTGRAKVIAVPRDTMVDVDLYSENNIFLRNETMQLCLSFAYGNGHDTSAQNVVTSVSRILYNVPITKYFVLDLDGIAPINDAIGGVTLESIYDLRSYGIKKGDTIHLEGDLTEAYVRTRDMDTVDASLNRTARQVQYIKAFASQALPAVVRDFGVVSRLYNTATGYSYTNLDLSNVTYLASLLLSKGVTEFDTVTLQGEMTESTREDYAEHVYAEFYPDEDSTLQIVLDTFYTQVD